VLLVAAAACRTTAPPPITSVPDPTGSPTVGAPLTPEQAAAARAAVGEAERGNFVQSERDLAQLPAAHPVRALTALEVGYLKGEKVSKEALELASGQPGYGPAWAFAVLAARREGELRRALDAAQHAETLQPGAGWGKVASEVRHAWIAAELEEGRTLLKRGDAKDALARARGVLDLDAQALGARMLAVQALLALGKSRDAAELVPGLPDTPEGLTLKGNVAEAQGEFDLAAELYGRLPSSDPKRCELLGEARRRWRLANAPPYLTSALASRALDRKGLAAIVAFEAPAVAAAGTGPVPVFEDVVQLPERGDIVAVARAGVITGDAVTHRFAPNRKVSAKELEAALGGLAAALGRPRPEWCNGKARGCLEPPEVADGRAAAALVLAVAGGGGEPCAQR
jgi:tetratricopeptide (TPR) repeat protein